MATNYQAFSILFWLNRNRMKNGRPSIILRLTIDNKRVELSTSQYVDIDQWDAKAQCVKGKTEDAKSINRQLAVMKSDLYRHYSLLLSQDQPITAEILKNRYLGIGVKQRTLSEALDLYISRFSEKVDSGRNAVNTLKSLKTTKDKLLSFVKHKYRTGISY